MSDGDAVACDVTGDPGAFLFAHHLFGGLR